MNTMRVTMGKEMISLVDEYTDEQNKRAKLLTVFKSSVIACFEAEAETEAGRLRSRSESPDNANGIIFNSEYQDIMIMSQTGTVFS
uniref:Uncharacterized protein n=1 Tax=Salix viminalis TaxID=40686 RepID=A0A6N2K789_SALVM